MTEEAREVLPARWSFGKADYHADGRWFSVRIMPYATMDDVSAAW